MTRTRWLLTLAAAVALALAVAYVVHGINGQRDLGREIDRCEAAGGEWARISGHGRFDCYRMERLEP